MHDDPKTLLEAFGAIDRIDIYLIECVSHSVVVRFDVESEAVIILTDAGERSTADSGALEHAQNIRFTAVLSEPVNSLGNGTILLRK
ncbi:hypothetical protein [Halocatena salina]|uniref:Uncharacterized protein n=1 Tax=Halocatena salina TaxID=2934340 RepID=A0A8U0A6L9_9EURY|nr:hypothetical protein [Halocatena salina]UPM44509.1 hypothetical protein MW046_13815 [Halocatena salina]